MSFSKSVLIAVVTFIVGGSILIIGWKMTSNTPGDAPSASVEVSARPETKPYIPSQSSLVSPAGTHQNSDSGSGTVSSAAAQFDQILKDTTQPDHVVGRKLLAIAADPAAPKKVRHDALTHGLDLIDEENYHSTVVEAILLSPTAPQDLQQLVWDDLSEREDPTLLEENARVLAGIEGHPLQEGAAEWIEDFGGEDEN
ncbi:MAG: hypothetical protein ACKVJU_12035 [Verrucomicrobiales bacterium]